MRPRRRDLLRSVGAAGALSALPIAGAGTAGATGPADDAGERRTATGRAPLSKPDAFEGWQAGDLHSHTTYSGDVCASPTCGEEAYTYGHTVEEQVGNAERRGLDYLALTDHNTVAHHDDPGFGSDSVTLLRSYEHSLAGGHGGMHGVSRTYDGRDTGDAEALSAVLDSVHDEGGFGVMNHPTTEISSTWEYAGPAGMDAVEVWSIAWYLERTPISPHNPATLRYYDDLLSAGHRLAAVGGSDNHWRSTHAVQGVGSPTTWVHAPDGDAAGIREAVRAGRTFVSWDWNGPLVTLEASLDGDRFEYGVGDAAPVPDSGFAAVRVTVASGLGHRVRLVSDGPVAETPVVADPFEWVTTVPVEPGESRQSFVRAEVLFEAEHLMRALTSPVYFEAPGYRGPIADPTAPEGTLPYPTEEPGWFPGTPTGASTGAGDRHGHRGGCECHPDSYRRELAVAESLLSVTRRRPPGAE